MSILTKLRSSGQTPAMVSLIVHAILGIAVIAFIVRSNPAIFKRVPAGPPLSALRDRVLRRRYRIDSHCAGTSISASCTSTRHEPLLGSGQLVRVHRDGLCQSGRPARPAPDYTISNVILLPLFTIIDGRRRGIRHPWLFFVSSLFTSFAFAWAFYLATVERQRRHQQARCPPSLARKASARPSSGPAARTTDRMMATRALRRR